MNDGAENTRPKPKRGRPLLGKEPMVNLSVTVSVPVFEALSARAEDTGRTKSSLAREALVDYLNQGKTKEED